MAMGKSSIGEAELVTPAYNVLNVIIVLGTTVYMKKIDRHFDFETLPVILFLEDLYRLQEILTVKSGTEFKISDDNYEYHSVDELISKRGDEELTGLTMKARDPFAEIELAKMWTRIRVFGGTERDNAGVAFQLEATLKKCHRPLFRWLNFKTFLLGNLLLSFPVFFHQQSFYFLAYAIFLMIVVWTMFIKLTRHSFVILRSRKQSGFIKRNRDIIVISLLTAIVGAAVGAFVTWSLSKVGIDLDSNVLPSPTERDGKNIR